MGKPKQTKKPSLLGILVAFVWFSFWALAVIGLWGETEKDYPLLIFCALLGAVGLSIGISGIKERKKPADVRSLFVEEEWIRDTLANDFQLDEKKATDIFHYYIEDVYGLNSDFYIPWREWATHLHRAYEKNMTKEEWSTYVKELKKTIPDDKKHKIRDVKEKQAQYDMRIERFRKENEKPDIKPAWIWQKIGNMWGVIVVILLVGSIVGFEHLSWKVQDFLIEHADIFTVVYMVGLMTISIGSHTLYMKWFERKYATFYENEKEIQELALKRWLLGDDLEKYVE